MIETCGLFNVKDCLYIHTHSCFGGVCGVMIIVVGNGHDDTISNPGRNCVYFTKL